MQIICVAGKCSAEARHYVVSSKRRDVVFGACTYHASGVFVAVGEVFGGKVSISTRFEVTRVAATLPAISGRKRHELAG